MSVICLHSRWRCSCLCDSLFFLSWLLTPKQWVACVSRGIITNRIADLQTNISTLNTEQLTQPTSRALSSNMLNVSVHAKYIFYTYVQRWVASNDRGSAGSEQGSWNNVFDVSAVILFQFLTSSHPLSYKFIQYIYNRHKCWGRREGRRDTGGVGETELEIITGWWAGWQKQKVSSVRAQPCTDTHKRHLTALVWPRSSVLPPSGVGMALNIDPLLLIE